MMTRSMSVSDQAVGEPLVIGRYQLHGQIAQGGMATVHYGRLVGEAGFSRTVAIKRLHPQFAREPEFVAMFTDEARLAARIRHPNVVTTLDVVQLEGELLIVMEYVQGESLSRLLRAARHRKERVPPRIVSAVLSGVLEGLHAAHEARNERDEPLDLVHRDVSPQNVLVGSDGIPRVLDFGVAKASGRLQTTRDGQLKGKISYMAPEQLRGTNVDRRTDVYAVGVVLWEALVGRRLFEGDEEVSIFGQVLEAKVQRPSAVVPTLPRSLDTVVMKGLHRDPALRFQTAHEMAIALERAAAPAPLRQVAQWVQGLAEAALRKRATSIAEIESVSDVREGVLAARAAMDAAPVVVEDADPEGEAPTVISDTSHVSELHPSLASVSQPSMMLEAAAATSPGVTAVQARPARGRGLVVTLTVVAIALAAALGAAITLLVAKQGAGTGAAASAVVAPPRPAVEPKAAPAAIEKPLPTAEATASALAVQPESEPSRPASPAPAKRATRHSWTAKPRPAANAAPKPVAPKPTAAPKPKPKPTVAPKPDCNPPYTIDEDGLRIPKPQCF